MKISNPFLSSELDAKSRQNAVMQFNKGRYDILIANDQADIDEVIQEGEHTKVFDFSKYTDCPKNVDSPKNKFSWIFIFRQRKKTKKQLKKPKPIWPSSVWVVVLIFNMCRM